MTWEKAEKQPYSQCPKKNHGLDLIKKMRDLYNKNFIAFKKETKRIQEDGKLPHANELVGLIL